MVAKEGRNEFLVGRTDCVVALQIGLKDGVDLGHGHVGQGLVVARGIDDHLLAPPTGAGAVQCT
jgi:hypothetical protein